MLNTLQTTDTKDKELPLSKRDDHAAIAAFSFCLRAVNSENGGAVLPFPRLISREIICKHSVKWFQIAVSDVWLYREKLESE